MPRESNPYQRILILLISMLQTVFMIFYWCIDSIYLVAVGSFAPGFEFLFTM